jgi:hypothetical protein
VVPVVPRLPQGCASSAERRRLPAEYSGEPFCLDGSRRSRLGPPGNFLINTFVTSVTPRSVANAGHLSFIFDSGIRGAAPHEEPFNDRRWTRRRDRRRHPHMTSVQGERISTFILENGITDVLELGFRHGVSTVYMATHSHAPRKAASSLWTCFRPDTTRRTSKSC